MKTVIINPPSAEMCRNQLHFMGTFIMKLSTEEAWEYPLSLRDGTKKALKDMSDQECIDTFMPIINICCS